jgi:deazaflavin-dependent oxidoreductase (nitroreductase family)
MVKFALNLQVFLLRRNWMGPAGNFIMVITTTGRKTGKQYARPITYIADGDTYIGTNTGLSNWYKNILVNPDVTLDIKGKRLKARCMPANSPEEKRAIFEIFRREQAANFVRIFGLPADSPEEALFKARDSRVYVRFHVQR